MICCFKNEVYCFSIYLCSLIAMDQGIHYAFIFFFSKLVLIGYNMQEYEQLSFMALEILMAS